MECTRSWLSFSAWRARIGQRASLQIQKAGDDLQIVFHPVVDLLKQSVLFLQRSVDLFLRSLAPGDVSDGANHARGAAVLSAHRLAARDDPTVAPVFVPQP
jgi:hypothetical protein